MKSKKYNASPQLLLQVSWADLPLENLQTPLLYNWDKTEVCTEHAQRSQLWHLSGEQSSHCVRL